MTDYAAWGALQDRAVARVRRAMAAGSRRVLLQLPTGGGKTRIAGTMLAGAAAGGMRAVFAVRGVELVAQAAAALRGYGLRVGVYAASDAAGEDPGAPVVVASVDTLVARGGGPPADLLVLDEARHFASETYARALLPYEGAWRVGLDATPERSDGQGLRTLFDALVVGATYAELTAAGVLVPLRCVRPDRPMRTGRIAQPVAEAYRAHADGRSALVYASTVALSDRFAAELRDAGVRAETVSADTPADRRAALIGSFRSGALPVLVSVGTLTEGFDAPIASAVLLARPCGTTGVLDQILGRGLRAAPGKTDCVLVDLVGATHIHGLPSEGREYSLTGAGVASSAERALASYCRVCGEIVTPGEPCPDCGTVPRVAEARTANAPLVAYDYRRNASGDPPHVRYARLVRWIGDAIRAGHKLAAAKGKYRAVFRQWPRGADWDRAVVEAQTAAMREGAGR